MHCVFLHFPPAVTLVVAWFGGVWILLCYGLLVVVLCLVFCALVYKKQRQEDLVRIRPLRIDPQVYSKPVANSAAEPAPSFDSLLQISSEERSKRLTLLERVSAETRTLPILPESSLTDPKEFFPHFHSDEEYPSGEEDVAFREGISTTPKKPLKERSSSQLESKRKFQSNPNKTKQNSSKSNNNYKKNQKNSDKITKNNDNKTK